MKILPTLLLSFLLIGCASTKPESQPALNQAFYQSCVKEQYAQIHKAWMRYEFRRHSVITTPNWRSSAMRWAQAECKVGRPNPDFRPKPSRF